MEDRDFIERHILTKIWESNLTSAANKKGQSVGLFWVLPSLNNKIIFSEITSEDLLRNNDFMSGKDNHYSVWRKLMNHGVIPEPYNNLKYDQIPRGRLIYNFKDDKYLMHATSSIIKNKLLCEYIFINYCKENDFTKCILVDDRRYRLLSIPDRG